MAELTELYRHSLALLTDLYQLTMANGYWKLGMADREAVFYLSFRSHPFNGGYSVACGLSSFMDYLAALRFDQSDIAYLAQQTGNDGQPLFDAGFLESLRHFQFRCDVDAIPEGTVVFPHEPLVRIRGPLLQGQLMETPLLNMINFQTLIATRAARVCMAAAGQPVVEFGLRRAQGIDGGITASRAAYVGGCAATSNVLAGKLFGIPIKGTHAHSWVMCFDSELEAFHAYAQAMPNNCIFLVDTYNTLQGVRHAIAAGRWLKEHGHRLLGIRLDSGDLAYLSIEARKLLDAAGFTDALILASNDLDEHIIDSLKEQGACIALWGVGTRLSTAFEQPALGGIYKLSAIRSPHPPGDWQYKLKLSEQTAKISTPGILQVRRYRRNSEFMADAIYDEPTPPPPACTIIDPEDMIRRKTIPAGTAYDDLLIPVFRQGQRLYASPPLPEIRRHTQDQLSRFHPAIKRLVNPHQYPVGLEEHLHDLRTQLILRARQATAIPQT